MNRQSIFGKIYHRYSVSEPPSPNIKNKAAPTSRKSHLSEQTGEVICIVNFPDSFPSSSFRSLDHDRVANLLSSLARRAEQQGKYKKAAESSERIIISPLIHIQASMSDSI